MGKNRYIKIIGRLIGGMTAHKLLLKYTNKPDSIPHMESEVENYRGTLADYITEFNWNNYDKGKIMKEAERCLKKELKKEHFNDVIIPDREKNKILKQAFIEFFNS